MHIDSYNFGVIVIDGRTYRQDLLIWPGTIKSDWWRGQSHLLELADLSEALDAGPETLVVGTGAYGNMKLDPALEEHLRRQDINLVAKPTGAAVQTINALSGKTRLAVALHLTC
jgi:hypothetical protein